MNLIGVGTRGCKRSAPRTLCSWRPPFCSFSIEKYYPMLCNFSHFSRYRPIFSRLPYTSHPLISRVLPPPPYPLHFVESSHLSFGYNLGSLRANTFSGGLWEINTVGGLIYLFTVDRASLPCFVMLLSS